MRVNRDAAIWPRVERLVTLYLKNESGLINCLVSIFQSLSTLLEIFKSKTYFGLQEVARSFRCSSVVPNLTTDRSRRCLTSVIQTESASSTMSQEGNVISIRTLRNVLSRWPAELTSLRDPFNVKHPLSTLSVGFIKNPLTITRKFSCMCSVYFNLIASHEDMFSFVYFYLSTTLLALGLCTQ